MKAFVIASIFLTSFYCQAQKMNSGSYFADKKWVEIKKSKEHFDSTSVFVTSDKIFLRLGSKGKIFKINKLSMLAPQLFLFDCIDEKNVYYRITYAIQQNKSFSFDIGKSLNDPDEIYLLFFSWSPKNYKE